MNKSPVSFSMVMILLALAGCQNPIQAPSSGSGSPKGNLIVSLPPVASAIAAQIGDARSLARVYAYATSYTISVQTSSGTPVVTYTGATTPSATPISVEVPVGSNYTVTVRIFNSSVSTSEPTVVGTATGVSIATGATTPLSLTCKPYGASSLSIGSAVSPTLAPNAEVYYRLDVYAGSRYTFTNSRSNLLCGLFDSNGASLSSWSTDSGSTTYTPTSNTTIYVGLAATATVFGTTTLTVTHSQGTSANPVQLAVGGTAAFRLGESTGTSSSSFYSFTPTSEGTHLLDLGAPTGTCTATLDTGSIGGTTVLAATPSASGLINLGTLDAGTTYYLTLTNTSTSAFVSYQGSVSFAASLPSGSTAYVPGAITVSGAPVWYVATVVNPSTHSLSWDDAYQGSGTFKLDVDVSAYKADLTSYFTGADSGYATPQMLSVTVGTVIYIKVRAYSGGSGLGTFGIRLN